jgi:hypothetical protein
MKTNAEKRTYARRNHTVPIALSYFNKKDCFDTQTFNHCADGMCLKSDFPLQPGATVYIRVQNFHPNGSCTGACAGLRSVTLAEVKWCNEVPGADTFSYEVGVKYYESVY